MDAHGAVRRGPVTRTSVHRTGAPTSAPTCPVTGRPRSQRETDTTWELLSLLFMDSADAALGWEWAQWPRPSPDPLAASPRPLEIQTSLKK